MSVVSNVSAEDSCISDEEFDAAWYGARYPDVAAAGIDLLRHYREHGSQEGRSPNAEREPRAVWAGRFDRDWYAAQYSDVHTSGLEPLEHFIRFGLRDGRFPNSMEAGRAKYSAVLDAEWYRDRNPDVVENGVDPLTHYVSQGILEGRRPNADIILESAPVTDARINCMKEPREFAKVALFVAHSPDGNLKPHVEPYLRALRDNRISTILIIAADRPFTDLPENVENLVTGIYVRENVGFDFSAWAHIINLRPQIWDADILYFLNDSVIGPTNTADFEQLIVEIEVNQADVIGLTENIDRGWHLQSYFLAFKRRALISHAMHAFVDNIVSYKNKNDVVNEYETRMASALSHAGLNCAALFSRPGASNPTLYHWETMLGEGCPFVKVSTIRGDTETVDSSHWRTTLSAYGYDTSIADRTLAEFWRSVMPAGNTLDEMEQRIRLKSLAELHDFLADKSPLKLTPSENPELSVVISNRNTAHATFQILKNLSTVSEFSAEYIVVDDGSTDASLYLLENIHGVTIVRNSEVIGPLRSANRGASRCRGRFALFLFADALVATDDLRRAVEMMREQTVGAVSAKVSRLDGRLVNAGSILWRDGSHIAFGMDQDMDGAEFGFVRDVDAGAAPFMLVDFDLFESLGRFDPDFNLLQSSVIDLCLRIRAGGRTIVYNPEVNVLSLNTTRTTLADFNSEQADRQRIASVHKWNLAKHHLPATAGVLWGRQADRSVPRLLVVGDRLPRAAMADLSPRAIATVEACRNAGYAVTFFAARHMGTDSEVLESQLNHEVEILVRSDVVSLGEILRERKAFYHVIYILGRHNMIDLVKYFLATPDQCQGVRIVYDTTTLATSPILQSRRRTNALLDNPSEYRLAELADVVVADCQESVRFLLDSGYQNVRLLPPVLRAPFDTPGFAERKHILVAACLDRDDSPDLNALFGFIETSIPQLDSMIGPSYTLTVIGPIGAPRLSTWRHPRVILHGPVDDPSIYIDQARLMIQISPAFDPGVFSAVCEGVARGLPSVLSPCIADQFSGQLRSALLVAETSEACAQACGKLYADKQQWDEAREKLAEAVRSEVALGRFAEHATLVVQSLQPLGLRTSKPLPPPRPRQVSTGRNYDQTAANASTRHSSIPKNKMGGDIAVVYLARGGGEDAPASFERFLNSYLKHAAGADHDFFVILKGFESIDAREVAEELFTKAGARAIHLSDNGFDLGAYAEAAHEIRNEQLCFLNTNAEILCDDWLYLMALHLRRPDVGLVGATGSFEALEAFQGTLHFPNVHLRSNAFLISRRLFRSVMGGRVFHTKEDAYAAESGPRSLTQQVLGRGFTVLVAGRNGRAYPPPWWPCSDTFRQGKQDNLIVGDNQTRIFSQADEATKQWLLQRAWGDLVDVRDLPQ